MTTDNVRKIDGITFKVGPMMAMDAFRIKNKLIKLFAPSFGKLFTSFDFNKDFKDLDLSKIPLAEIIQQLTAELDDNTTNELLQQLLYNVTATTTINGKPLAVSFASDFETAFNTVFSQKLFTVYPLLAFVLEVNFPDFFQKIKNIGSRMKKTYTSKKVKAPLLDEENN